MTDSKEHRVRFVAQLVESGALDDPAWRSVFAQVPRHEFVPYYFESCRDRLGWALVEQPADEWLAGVYSVDHLVTQVGGDDKNVDAARHGYRVEGPPTSSSSAPGLMARMLRALDLDGREQVLEIGTGTGYNAALLCERLGSDRVATVDVDEGLVDTARERLSTLGYKPRVVATDGAKGLPDGAPYDRVIATVGLRSVPQAWIEQTRTGGMIVVPLDRLGRGGLLARLIVHSDHSAEGFFLPNYGGFMPVRVNQTAPAQQVLREVGPDEGESKSSPLPADLVTDPTHPFEFFGALTIPGDGWESVGFTPSGGGLPETWLAQNDGSWVCHVATEDGAHMVRQGGPRRLWDEVEKAHAEWTELGQPERARFGLTVSRGHHVAWLDEPHGPHHWTLAT
ncbi:ATP-grasp peptide maturase system methyltransferase [Amycolatopsis japonica]|uniref:ATP-grasp peptide maturase system methyltransferase n=1 Tax=Amycolatopsis japonica TaxID=208439 RepID=UPI003333F938